MFDSRVQVVVRLRPPLLNEDNNAKFFQHFNTETNVLRILSKNNSKGKKFQMDQLFDPTSTQEDIFTSVARPLADQVLNGYNATMLAYGATGTGKTHTMIGEKSVDGKSGGIIPRTLEYIITSSVKDQ